MGFITSPLDFSDSERQARALTRPVEDASLQPQTRPLSEVEEDRAIAVSPVEMNQAAGEETGEPAQATKNETAIDRLLSVEPLTKG